MAYPGDGPASADPEAADERRRLALVWDLPTRAFHWIMVVLVAAAYGTWRLGWMDWHAWIGEALLATILFRLLWGLWGSETARFSSFVSTPARAARRLAHLFRREPVSDIGHNPAGAWMVLLLLALLLGQALTGIYVNNDVADQGPLTDISPPAVANLITALHDSWFWDALLAAVALHLAAIIFYRVVKGQSLTPPMITGRRVLPPGAPAPRSESLLRAGALFICSIAIAAALANFL